MNFTGTPAGAIRLILCVVLFYSIGQRVLYFIRYIDEEIACAQAT